jgi:PEP-CTERM motif
MKRILLLGVLALALPMAVFAANSVDYTNSGGTLAGSNSGLALTGSTLVAVKGLNGGGLITGNDLGSISLSTGALTSGSLQMGGMFAAGGSFAITGNGTNGIPNGTLFSGTFGGPATWTLVTLANGTHNYTLSGILSGTTSNGAAVGVTVELTINTGKGFFNGSTTIAGGMTDILSGGTKGVVPEPGSLSLLGIGFISLAGMMRRKLKS